MLLCLHTNQGPSSELGHHCFSEANDKCLEFSRHHNKVEERKATHSAIADGNFRELWLSYLLLLFRLRTGPLKLYEGRPELLTEAPIDQ